MTDSHRPASRADQLDIRERDAALLLRDPALYVTLRVGTHVLLHQHDVFDQNLVVVREQAQDTAFIAFVPASNHFDVIVPPNVNPLMFSAHSMHFDLSIPATCA